MNTISLIIQAHKKPSNPSSAAKLAPVPTRLAPLRSRKSACEDHFNRKPQKPCFTVEDAIVEVQRVFVSQNSSLGLRFQKKVLCSSQSMFRFEV